MLDLAFSLGLFAVVMVYYRWPLSGNIIFLPLFILGAILFASGAGLILSALNVAFRDVKYAVPFLVQMGVTTQEEIEQLYQQMLIDMHQNTFCSMLHFVTILGTRP